MKRIYLILIFSFILHLAQAQLTALFVNDNKVDTTSTTLIYGILEQYLGTLDRFDAVTEDRSPTAQEMESYKLVIWYCGMDADELYFWNDNYQDNLNLETYLDAGGSLWVLGQNIFNARYIKAPRNYSEGNFVYDYLGIERWAAESYTDDNGFGVPVLEKDDNSLVAPSLDSLSWEDPPEPLVDACDILNGADRVYLFGPTGYIFYGKPAAIYYPHNGFKNMIFTFDPYRLDSKGAMEVLLSDILMFYEDVLSNVAEIPFHENIRLYPNPAAYKLTVEFDFSGRARIRLIDLVGNVLMEQKVENNTAPDGLWELDISDFPSGMFFLNIETANQSYSKTFVVSRK